MKHSIKSLLAALVVSLSLTAPVLAGPYEDGHAAARRGDNSTAAVFYRKEAEQGHSDAQVELGSLYEWGRGVTKNLVEAAAWYRKAAEQGNTRGQLRLGLLYREGLGVPQDYVEAHKWVNLAGARAWEDDKLEGMMGGLARWVRTELTILMTPAQIAEAQRLAREWKPKK